MDPFRLAPLLTLAAAVALPPQSAVELRVDVSALSALPPRALEAMTREATDLWRPNGVTLVWIVSPEAGPSPGAVVVLREPPAWPRAARAHAGHTLLGAALFVEGRVTADRVISVAVAALERLVEEAPWAGRRVGDWPKGVRDALVGRALGRVLAHELGHYLIAWRAHTPEGLMRAGFRGDRLIDPDRRPFELSRSLGPRLNGRLRQIQQAASAAASP